MVEDLLSRIEQELYERMEELYPAVDECDRLQADLEALEALPEPPVEPETSYESEPPYEPEPSAALSVDPEPSGAVLCFPGNRKPVRTAAVSAEALRPISTLFRPASVPASASARAVSPKVARLMLAPRRPALERSGIPRVGAGV
jgi:hypothetical protein